MFNKMVATPNTVVSQHRDTLLAHAAIAHNLAKKTFPMKMSLYLKT
jgi:hypothetical protein